MSITDSPNFSIFLAPDVPLFTFTTITCKSLFLSMNATTRLFIDPAWFKAKSTIPVLWVNCGAFTCDPISNKCSTCKQKIELNESN